MLSYQYVIAPSQWPQEHDTPSVRAEAPSDRFVLSVSTVSCMNDYRHGT